MLLVPELWLTENQYTANLWKQLSFFSTSGALSRVQIRYRDYTRCEYDLNRMVSSSTNSRVLTSSLSAACKMFFTGPSYAPANDLVTSIFSITASVDDSDFSTTQTNRNHKYGQARS